MQPPIFVFNCVFDTSIELSVILARDICNMTHFSHLNTASVDLHYIVNAFGDICWLGVYLSVEPNTI